VERADAPTLVPWLNDPETTRNLLIHRPVSLAFEEAFLNRLAESATDIVLGIMVRQSDQFIGVTGFHDIDTRNRQVSFGIAIGDKSAWGKGYGTEATRLMVGYAFNTLNLNRVHLRVYEYNERGRRAYEKAGFRVEGRLRQDTFRDGRYWDSLMMAVLREDWQADASQAS
jgi:RimJ/RimL family protein N-acetyltransferase